MRIGGGGRSRRIRPWLARRRNRTVVGALIFVVTLVSAVTFSSKWHSKPAARLLPRPVVLALKDPGWLPASIRVVSVDAKADEPNVDRLRMVGFGVSIASIQDFNDAAVERSGGIWWITNAAALKVDPQVVQTVLDDDGRVLLDGPSPVAQTLLKLRPAMATVNGGVMQGEELQWDTAYQVHIPSVPYETLATAVDSSAALTRSGGLMWSLPKLDGEQGIERLPFLPQALEKFFGLLPRFASNGLELYVDPDLESGRSMRELAAAWKSNGVRRLFVAAWKDDKRNGRHYDYKAFVSAMHEQNIEVFAWLEWPHVNFSFWDMHPYCKEKTATGADAQVFWRSEVALTVDKCFDLAWQETRDLLATAPFDGVNVAELSFESPGQGPDDPKEYTPFHPEAREAFRKRAGFDPIELVDETSFNFWKTNHAAFKSWVAFREEMITEIHRKLFARLRTVAAGKKLMVTIIEDRSPLTKSSPAPSTHPLGENLGSNSKQIAALRSEGAFELQMEDPFTVWMLDPERYRNYPALYPEVPADQLVLDINIVERGYAFAAGRVTARPTGIELYRSIASVGRSGAQLALYASGTLHKQDLRWAKYALGGDLVDVLEEEGDRLVLEARRPVTLQLVRPMHKVSIDGVGQTFDGRRQLEIPTGKHTIVFG
jgi:hypothetical protein